MVVSVVLLNDKLTVKTSITLVLKSISTIWFYGLSISHETFPLMILNSSSFAFLNSPDNSEFISATTFIMIFLVLLTKLCLVFSL